MAEEERKQITLSTEQIAFATILLSEFPYYNIDGSSTFKDALNMAKSKKFTVQEVNDMKEFIADFLFELVTIYSTNEEELAAELEVIKNTEAFKSIKGYEEVFNDDFTKYQYFTIEFDELVNKDFLCGWKQNSHLNYGIIENSDINEIITKIYMIFKSK